MKPSEYLKSKGWKIDPAHSGRPAALCDWYAPGQWTYQDKAYLFINAVKTQIEKDEEDSKRLMDVAQLEVNEQCDQHIYCRNCETFVTRKELKRWTGDDRLHYLCPGCDADLVPVEPLE